MSNWEQDKARGKEMARCLEFEGAIEHLEAVCRQIPGIAWPGRSNDRPEKHTQAWFAEEILYAIDNVRHHLKRGHPKHAAAEALTVGSLAMEAEARLNWPELRKLREMRERNRESAKKRGRSLSVEADARRLEIADAAEKYRRLDSAKHSQRGMAHDLGSKLGIPENTVRDHLRKLGIK